jgi:hypothetical protein
LAVTPIWAALMLGSNSTRQGQTLEVLSHQSHQTSVEMGSATSATQSHPALIQISVPFSEAPSECIQHVVSRAMKIGGVRTSRKIANELSVPLPVRPFSTAGIRVQGSPLISIKVAHQP